jgi:hypothetical protein
MPDHANNSDSSSVSSSGKLPKLTNDKTTNNYSEWMIESEVLLLGWDLLDYVTGPLAKPPDIPPLCKTSTSKGVDNETGIEHIFIIRGNLDEHNKKLAAAKPWMKKNNVALSKIFQAVSRSKQIYLIKGI